MMKRGLQNAAILLISCLIALGGIEIALCVWGPDVIHMGTASRFHRFDPVLGWNNLEGAEGRFTLAEFSYPVRINADGLWDADVRPKSPGEFRVAVLGDSFTWGWGIGYRERFTEIVEDRNPRINVLNFGVSGFSPIQYMLQLDHVFALNADYVVAAICLGNDIFENITFEPYGYPKPYVRLNSGGDGFEVRGYPLPERVALGSYLFGRTSPSRIISLISLYVNEKRQQGVRQLDDMYPTSLYVPLEKLAPKERKRVAEAYKLNELILAEMKRKIEGNIGRDRFAVLLVPTKWDFPGNLPFSEAIHDAVAKEVLASLTRLRIPAIDGREVLTQGNFWKRDEHWNASGHKKIGEQLGNFLNGLID